MNADDIRVLRNVAATVLVLCGVAVVVGFIPGVDVYEDKNDCIGQAFSRAFSWHGSSDSAPCVRNDVLLRTEAAGGLPLVIALLPVALGALVVRRWPRLWIAALWPFVLVGSIAIFFAFTFDLDLFSPIREVPRWPATLTAYTAGAIAVVLLAVLIGVPIVAWRNLAARRAEQRRQQTLAPARVVKIGD